MPSSSATVRWAIGAWLAASLTLFAGVASAQRTSSLSWVRLEGAERCISTQALAQRVEGRIGRRVFVSASQADLSLEGHVRREGDGLVAELVVSDPAGAVLGRRVLRVAGTDCSALEASLVLVIAIGIDPDAALPPDARASEELSDETKTMLAQLELPKLTDSAVLALAVPEPQPRSRIARAARRPPAPPPPLAAAAPPRPVVDRFRLGLHAGVALELGVLPDPGVGLTLRVSVRAPPVWPVELSFAGLLPQTQAVAEDARAGEFQFWAIGLATCPLELASGALSLEACAGVRAGSLRARGRDFAQPLSAAATWLDAGLAAGPSLRLDWVRLELRGRAALPISADTFVYEDRRGQPRRAHRPGAVIGSVELGAAIFF